MRTLLALALLAVGCREQPAPTPVQVTAAMQPTPAASATNDAAPPAPRFGSRDELLAAMRRGCIERGLGCDGLRLVGPRHDIIESEDLTCMWWPGTSALAEEFPEARRFGIKRFQYRRTDVNGFCGAVEY